MCRLGLDRYSSAGEIIIEETIPWDGLMRAQAHLTNPKTGKVGARSHQHVMTLSRVAGSALVYALLALNSVIELEQRFPETD